MSQSFHEKIQQFTEEICSQIRCKKIHKEIASEIECHVLDQKENYEKEGFSEQEATQKAIISMGNAVEIGQKLDEIHRPKPNWIVLILIAVTICTGFFLRFLMFQNIRLNRNFFVSSIFGLFIFCIAYFMDYTILEKYFKLFFGIFLFFSLSIFSPISFFMTYVNGTKFFLNINGYHFLLLFLPIFSVTVYRLQNRGLYGIFLCGIVYSIFFLFGFNIPTSTGVLIVTFSCLIILTIAICKNWFGGSKIVSLSLVYVPLFISIIGAVVFLPSFSYRYSRFSLFFRPELDPTGRGYQGV